MNFLKNLLSVIRWKFVIPTAVFIGLLVAFFVIFFDPLLEKGVEAAASSANGARVDVDGLKTKFADGRISIARVQVTNPDSPMRNTVDFGPAAFQLDLGELFSKRAIIHEASLKGLKFDTERKRSGAMPKLKEEKKKDEPPSAAEKLAAKYQNQFSLNLKDMKADGKAKVEFDEKDLELYKQGEALKAKTQALPDQWKARVDGLDVDGRLKKIQADLESIKNTDTKGPQAITAIPEALKKLKASKEDLNKVKADVQATKDALAAELKGLKADVAGLADAKKRDLDNLKSRLNLDFANPRRLLDGMIGPIVLQRFQQAFRYAELAKKHMPSKVEKASLPPKPRAKGMDITFPTPAAPPTFWLKKAVLDGELRSVAASGSLSHLTSDAAKVGEPFIALLKGEKGAERYAARALWDATKDVSKGDFDIRADGLNAADFVTPEAGGFAAALKEGVLGAGVNFRVDEKGALGGLMNFDLKSMKLDDAPLLALAGLTSVDNLSAQDAFKASFMRNIARGIEKMPSLEVKAALSGTMDDPNLDFSSNLEGVLSKVVKDTVGGLVDEQTKELKARLDKLQQEKTAELTKKIEELNGKLGEFGGLQKKIDDEIKKASGVSLSPSSDGSGSLPGGIKVPDLNKLFKR